MWRGRTFFVGAAAGGL